MIALARTFVFVRDIKALLEANLIKGGDNAIVICLREVSQKNRPVGWMFLESSTHWR